MSTIDYHDFTDVDTPKEERNKLGVGDIYINAARCFNCEDVVRSRNRHDFRTCRCGNISVDGGSWYTRRSYQTGVPFENIVVLYTDASEKERKELEETLKG